MDCHQVDPGAGIRLTWNGIQIHPARQLFLFLGYTLEWRSAGCFYFSKLTCIPIAFDGITVLGGGLGTPLYCAISAIVSGVLCHYVLLFKIYDYHHSVFARSSTTR
jgi:hypothetical protein